MDKQIYAQLMDQYRVTRENNWRVEQQRKDEVFTAHPDIEMLHNKRHQMILGSVRNAFQGLEGLDLVSMMENYNREIRELLVRYGYAPDYLAPVYQCEKCQDTGLVGEPIKTECECFRKAYIAAAARQSTLRQDEQTFENFDLNRFPGTMLPGQSVTQRDYMKVLRRKCEAFADSYPGGSVKNLLLHGGSGLGKTYLLHCIANRQQQLGREALYVTAYQLLDDLRNDFFRPGSADCAIYEEAELLLIDDLGMEPLFENITVELIFNLFNQRMLKGLGTVISTNLNHVELKERYTERFTSRLLDARTCLDLAFLGQDIRLIK